MPEVEVLTTDEVEARRARLLVEVGMTEGELRSRGAAYSLSEHEAAVLDEIDSLDFLLG
jgi:hypothetical protein